jgi:ppGpp synthetase/RelA/SpoT-type nucleotidyltranferase
MYSIGDINRAGQNLRNESTLQDEAMLAKALAALSYWRFSHEDALGDALEMLEKFALTKDRTAFFAKRLKRLESITAKLRRFPDMKLARMQDIGGCRAIVTSEKKLRQIARDLKLQSEFREGGKVRSKDYLEDPKPDGYRGFHIIGTFQSIGDESRNIEVQIRTRIQHYWATALEIVDLFTGQALKSNNGNPEWARFFATASSQFAMMDKLHLFITLTQSQRFERFFHAVKAGKESLKLCRECQRLVNKLKVLKKFEAFAGSLRVVEQEIFGGHTEDGYVLLQIDINAGTVETRAFREAEGQLAEKEYTTAERQAAGRDERIVALVSSNAVGGIKEAYPNYFADSSKFIHLLSLVMGVK